MAIIIYDSDVYTYDADNVDYEGVEDTLPEDTSDPTYLMEVSLLTEDEAGPSELFNSLGWARVGVHFICDDITDSITISVSNDGVNYVTRCTLTGPTMEKIGGPWKYIKATRITGNGAVVIVLSQDLYFY